jgi:hypothetical protein
MIMPLYAKVKRKTGEVLEYREFSPDTEFADHKPVLWLPVREEAAATTPIAGQEKVETQVAADLVVGEVVRRQAVVTMTAAEKSIWAKEGLVRSDLRDMPRFSEDVALTLIIKGVIALTDLPQPAQDTLAARKALRKKLSPP